MESRSFRVRGWIIGAAALLAASGSAVAQEQPGPLLDAGDVATVVLRFPAPPAADSASYVLDLADGFRAFVPAEGRVLRMEGEFLLPITFTTPATLAAGRVIAGHVTLTPDGRQSQRRELAIRIRGRRDLVFELVAEELAVAPDAVVEIPFRARNRGNLPDTLHTDVRASQDWTVLEVPRLVLAPADSGTGVIRLAAPATADPGDREILVVRGRSVDGEHTAAVSMVFIAPSGWFGDLAQVPSSIFVGQTLGTDLDPVVALTGGGKISQDTELQLELRHFATGLVDPALQRQMAGARMRASLVRPRLEVTAGDVYGFETTLGGALRQSRGIRSTWDPEGPLSLRGIAALPLGFGGTVEGGHILHGEAGWATDYGTIHVLGADLVRPSRGGIAETRTSGGGLRWQHQRGLHEASVEGSVARFVAADSLERLGPAVDVRYRLDGETVTGRFRFRRVPDAATDPGGLGNELSGSFSAILAPDLYVVGWGYDTRQNLLGNATATDARAANLGVRGRVGRFQLQLGGALSERVTTTEFDSFELSRAIVRTEASATLGPWALHSNAELGEARELGLRGTYGAIGGSVRWYSDDRWAWVRLRYSRRPGGIETTSVYTGGSYALGRVEVSGGLSTAITGAAHTTSFWSATEIVAERNLSVHFGASSRPSLDAADWTFSLGVSRRLNLPLPVVRQPDLQGVVFEDANANGAMDPGEAPIPNVSLTLGYLETETDAAGRFSFRDATGAELRLQSADLPLGYVVSPDAVMPSRGDASIPLLRTATLRLALFLDRDGDGEKDTAESVGDGAVVTLTDAFGRQRTGTADSTGIIRMSGLIPGRYTVTARPPGTTMEPGQEAEVLTEIELLPGETIQQTLPVPLRRRTIRMESGNPGGLQDFELE